MILAERVTAFQQAYPDCPDAWPYVSPSGRWLYGTWEIGADYRNKSSFYGTFPPRFLERLMTLFPDAGGHVLHVFSGALPPGPYVRLDLEASRGADVTGNVYDVATLFPAQSFRLIVADPPYTPADAKLYGTPMVHKRRAIAALAAVARPGAHLAWFDTCWPMHNKKQWRTMGRILVQRSTNHRVRVLTLFERVYEPQPGEPCRAVPSPIACTSCRKRHRGVTVMLDGDGRPIWYTCINCGAFNPPAQPQLFAEAVAE